MAWLWQGLALALVVHLGLRWLPRLNAATRHYVWWVTLAAVLTLPCVRLTIEAAGSALAPVPDAAISVGSSAAEGAAVLFWLPVVPEWMVAAGAWTWLGIALIGLLRLGRGVISVRRLKRQAVLVPDGTERRLSRWAMTRNRGRAASLCMSNEVQVPCALGLGRGVILLPATIVDELSDVDLDQVVMHEYAHLARWDDWWRLLQSVIEAVVGLHPAVWWVGRRIDLEREVACDDFVVAHAGAVRPYASCLAQVAGLTVPQGAFGADIRTLAPGAVGTGSMLRQRVMRLLDGRRNGALRPSPGWLAATAGVLLVGMVGLGHTTPGVAFVETNVPLPSPPRPAAIELPAVPVLSVPHLDAAGPVPSTLTRPAPEKDSVLQVSTVSDGRPLMGAGSDVIEPAPPALPINSLGNGVRVQLVGAPIVTPSSTAPRETARDGGSWRVFGDAGTAIGAGAKKSGTAVVGFFARTGQAVASSF